MLTCSGLRLGVAVGPAIAVRRSETSEGGIGASEDGDDDPGSVAERPPEDGDGDPVSVAEGPAGAVTLDCA